MDRAYIQGLVKPTAKTATERKAWSIGLHTVWIPFFTATNVTGDTAIPTSALGAPERLVYDKDTGAVKFSKAGRPVIHTAKDLADAVKAVQANFTASLLQHKAEVVTAMPEAYAAEVAAISKAGEPIKAYDGKMLAAAETRRAAIAAEAADPGKAEAIAEAEATVKKPRKAREAVAA